MRILVLISLLLFGTVAACVACTPATEETVVSKGVGMVQVSEDAGRKCRQHACPTFADPVQHACAGGNTGRSFTGFGDGCPIFTPKNYGVELSEAIRRLTLQEPIGKLGATLESNEAGTLGGFWIQHEPE